MTGLWTGHTVRLKNVRIVRKTDLWTEQTVILNDGWTGQMVGLKDDWRSDWPIAEI